VADLQTANPEATGPTPARKAETLRIWAGVPLRNPDFTGREAHLSTLRKALDRQSKASVLPHALHGLGGVGKTQLAVEFAYRYADQYDIVCWIPAENQTLVLQSLRELGRSLGTPETASLQQSARLVLDRLAASPARWLLVYDNANDPDEVVNLIPDRGGQVILTSRNQKWSELWDPIKVDVFDRVESVELILKRGAHLSVVDAELLAARLDDLPLALDQAASCQAAAAMPADEYLSRLDQQIQAIAAEQPPSGPTTLAALVRLTLDRLHARAPAAGELLEMFAFLGAEPISRGLLRRGRDARVSPALAAALRNPPGLNGALRELGRYGIAKVDGDWRIQVHRLFQLVLRDQIGAEALERSRVNVHRVLASANPGYPEDEITWADHAEIGPHIDPARLVHSEIIGARQVVIDQATYLKSIGDLEGACRLAEEARETWRKSEAVAGLGPDGEQTLLASSTLAVALRLLGFNERAHALAVEVFDRLRRSPEFGPDHEHTLAAANEVGPNLRVAGLFREALRLDEDSVARKRRLFRDDDPETLRARGNLAVNSRMLSDFAGAYEIDDEAVRAWQQTVSENDNRLLFAQTNLARDLYGLGRYEEALRLQERIFAPFRGQLGSRHPHVLLARRTLAITLRKVGRYADALTVAQEHHIDTVDRYGPDHEHSLAAAMTLANSRRVVGDLAAARELAGETAGRYLQVFGEDHPLTLSATANLAIALRGLGEPGRARRLDRDVHARMSAKLGPRHGYTLCALNGLAIDLALTEDPAGALDAFRDAVAISRETRGPGHPYTLACTVNAALAASVRPDRDADHAVLDRAIADLAGVLGEDHPETDAARRGAWAECDIEPPPT
jgi:tetratricopeptide (TPR) repeat protein